MLKLHSRVLSEIGEGDTFEELCVGVPREPQQFIEAAVALGHPRFLFACVSHDASAAIDGLLGNAADLSLARTGFLKMDDQGKGVTCEGGRTA